MNKNLFQDLETSPETKRTKENDINFVLKLYNSDFETYEIPPGLYEVSDINQTSDNLVKAIISKDINTKKSSFKTKKISKFDEKSF